MKQTGGHLSGPWDTFFDSITRRILLTLSSDTTGYGFHGDFGSGWDQELQRAIDECDSTPDQLNGAIDAYPLLTIQRTPEAQKFKMPALLGEDIADLWIISPARIQSSRLRPKTTTFTHTGFCIVGDIHCNGDCSVLRIVPDPPENSVLRLGTSRRNPFTTSSRKVDCVCPPRIKSL